jgi:hypothetical protein
VNPINLQFLSNLKNRPEIQDVVVRYFTKLERKQVKYDGNLDLIVFYKDVKEVNKIGFKYMRGLRDKELYEKKNLEFIGAFIKNSSDPYFSLFFDHYQKIDSIVGKKNYSQQLVDAIILKEEINPIVMSTKEGSIPDWESMANQIKSKYGATYAERNICNAKIAFYKYWVEKFHIGWEEYLQLEIDKVTKYGVDTTNSFVDTEVINNVSWDIFMHSSDNAKISTAIIWMEGYVRRAEKRSVGEFANALDTYANLIYKHGMYTEAISLEEKALSLQPKNRSFSVALEKMKKSEPTWE